MGEDKKLDQKRKLFLKSKLLDYALKRAEENAKEKAEKKAAKINERLPPLPGLNMKCILFLLYFTRYLNPRRRCNSTALQRASRFFVISDNLLNDFLAQTDKTDDNRYDLEAKNVKMTKEIVELRKRVQEVKGTLTQLYSSELSFRAIQKACPQARPNQCRPDAQDPSRRQGKSRTDRYASEFEEEIIFSRINKHVLLQI